MLIFVIGSMLCLGLSLTMKQVIDPLKNVRLVVAAQNFDAYMITYLMVVAIFGLVILMPTAGELGRQRQA